MPKVSVVVPNYNHARFLRQRLDTVLGQTFQDFELIILDDGSTDDSCSIISEYAKDPRVRIEFNEKNSGSAFKQWNKGMRLAGGEYVWIAESDDYADERLLEKLVSRLNVEPDAALCNCRSWQVSSNGEIIESLDSYLAHLDAKRWTEDFSADGREECRKYLICCNTVQSASSVLFRKKVYEQVGGADESLTYCGDWKLWAAMALRGGTIAHVGEPLNYYRSHESTVTAKSQRLGLDAVEYLHVVRWILERVKPSEATQQNVRDQLFAIWYPRVLTNKIPLRRRWAILQEGMAVDPKALPRLVRPALVALRMTLARRYRSLRLKLQA